MGGEAVSEVESADERGSVVLGGYVTTYSSGKWKGEGGEDD